jgi:hypothetical protein
MEETDVRPQEDIGILQLCASVMDVTVINQDATVMVNYFDVSARGMFEYVQVVSIMVVWHSI